MHAFQESGLFRLHREFSFLLLTPIREEHPKQSPKIEKQKGQVFIRSQSKLRRSLRSCPFPRVAASQHQTNPLFEFLLIT